MTHHERQSLLVLDHEIDARPNTLGKRALAEYRELLVRHVAEQCATRRSGGRANPGQAVA